MIYYTDLIDTEQHHGSSLEIWNRVDHKSMLEVILDTIHSYNIQCSQQQHMFLCIQL